MLDHQAMPDVDQRRRIIFAELDTGGKIIRCPNCHVPFKPHLGNWIVENFPCGSCNANISFRNSKAKTTRCPCCNYFRPLPFDLIMLVCGGCQVKVIHQKRDKAVKCYECKHINIPTVGRTYGVPPPNHDPPQVNRDGPRQVSQDPPQVDRVGSPQIDEEPPQIYQTDHLQAHRDFAQAFPRFFPGQRNQVPPQVNRGGPHLVNQDPSQVYQAVPQQVNRLVPPRVYHQRNRAATESTASSPFTQPRNEIFVVEYPDATVAEAVRNVAIKREVETEEDKTEAAGSKKIRL